MSPHRLIVSTFRSPYLYTLEFDPKSGKLERDSKTHEATSGHSWLDLSPNRKFLYATGWGKPETVVAYKVSESTSKDAKLNLELINTAKSDHLSGYVVASHDNKFLFSGSGPQTDAFPLDPQTGAFTTDAAVQRLTLFANKQEEEDFQPHMKEFGGLKHGGHSADLSPDGKTLYVADLGRNCIHVYGVDTSNTQQPLKPLSRNVAVQRKDDAPRHVWPHPNGKIVYSLQEHSSFIDILELQNDGSLVWKQGVSIIPPEETCKDYWADEVRLSPSSETLFGSTRGLKPETKGWVAAYKLDPKTGLLAQSPKDEFAYCHLRRTDTSGGLANAIAVCPKEYDGKTYFTLTCSEVGLLQVWEWSAAGGLKVVAQEKFSTSDEHVGIAVAVWYD